MKKSRRPLLLSVDPPAINDVCSWRLMDHYRRRLGTGALHLKMLGRVGVGSPSRFFAAIDDEDLAVIAPGSFRIPGVEFGQPAGEARHKAHHLSGEIRGERNKPSGWIVAMLSLANEIGGDDLRIRGRVRDDHNFFANVDRDARVLLRSENFKILAVAGIVILIDARTGWDARSGRQLFHAFRDNLCQLQHLLAKGPVFRDVVLNAIAIGV
jgi:hypothetical protein